MKVTFDDGSYKYACSFCRRNFTAEAAPHVSLQLGPRSGFASPYGALPGWRLQRVFRPLTHHFCAPPATCLSQFITALVIEDPEGLREYLQ